MRSALLPVPAIRTMPPVWVAVASVPRVSLHAVTWEARPECLIFFIGVAEFALEKKRLWYRYLYITAISVADSDPSDSYAFGPPGSGPVSQVYGSGTLYHQAKIVRKNLDSCCFVTSF